MNPLLLDNINAKAPYRVYQIAEAHWLFDTDYGVSYDIGFDPDDTIWQDDAYMFNITNTNNKKSPLDPKLKDTILAIIEEFFRTNPSIMLYICATGDQKQAARNRLFERWFNEGIYKDLYCYRNAIITAEGVDNYAAIIVQRSNEQLEEILQTFNEFVSLMKNKPE